MEKMVWLAFARFLQANPDMADALPVPSEWECSEGCAVLHFNPEVGAWQFSLSRDQPFGYSFRVTFHPLDKRNKSRCSPGVLIASGRYVSKDVTVQFGGGTFHTLRSGGRLA